MSRYVLDSYAILVLIYDEPTANRVDDLLRDAVGSDTELHMSVINFAEVQYAILRRSHNPDELLGGFRALPIRMASVDQYIPQIVELKARYPVSLADCFAAALAIDLDCPLVTGDPEFRKLESILSVEWLGG
jgi:ribonuclease VapC